MDRPLDAARLVGLLAEDDRRAVVAALVLGAADLDQVVHMTGLGLREAADALGRLIDAGLVEEPAQPARPATLQLSADAFATAARTAAGETTTPRPDADDPDARTLGRFFVGGRLVRIPAQRSKRRVVLDRLAQEFEPGQLHSEWKVNVVLKRWHDDTASLRRHLVDEGFLDRRDGFYWRTGGHVET